MQAHEQLLLPSPTRGQSRLTGALPLLLLLCVGVVQAGSWRSVRPRPFYTGEQQHGPSVGGREGEREEEQQHTDPHPWAGWLAG